MADTPPPSGLARRRQRLSDEETSARMLAAATTMVQRTGLTVSLDHIGFEDVIREAGVARSAVYRRWPYKDLFVNDLLRELARIATPTTDERSLASAEVVRLIAVEHLHWLETPELRQALLTEMIRKGALHDFETIRSSVEWRTYIALHATFLSLDNGELRDDVRDGLATAEQDFVARISASWTRLATALGFRLRPELGASFDTMASLALGAMRGLAIMALSTPDVSAQRIKAKPFGANDTEEWSQAALAIAGIVFTFLEHDSLLTWDRRRIEKAQEELGLGKPNLKKVTQPGRNTVR